MAAGPDATKLDALERELALARAERDRTLEQQAATTDILRVISESPSDIAPVMVAVAKAAVRFCGAEDSHVFLRDGNEMVSSAHEGPLSSHALGYRDALDASNTARADTIVEARITHLPDTLAPEAETAYRSIRENSIQHGFRAQLNAPMLRDGQAIGCICLRRRDPGAFTPRQIALLETFAAQAVIAIENVRLFTELREALEQQTATSEVLQVISKSPGDLHPVFEAMLDKAMNLCQASFGLLASFDGKMQTGLALRGASDEVMRRFAQPLPIEPQSAVGRLARSNESVIHLLDAKDDEAYRAGVPSRVRFVDETGARTALWVALRKDEQLIGVFVFYRREVRAFNDKQIALLKTFADQAVIAMENARLLADLRLRTNDLAESLDYQTATSDVLSVISRSTSELEPVLRSMLAAATRLCGVHMGGVAVRRGDVLRYVTSTGVSAEFDKWLRETPHPMDRTSIAGRAAIDKRVTYIPNVAADPDYAMPITTTVGNMQSLLAVPLLREDEVVGVMTLGRSNTDPFSERQIALVRTFADQAVIAMENTRLLADLRESLDYQTATSEVLEVISRSTSDIQPVYDRMLSSAARLCGVVKGDIAIRQGEVFRHVAFIGATPEELAWLKERVTLPGRGTSTARALLERQVVHVLDQSRDPEREAPNIVTAARTMLSVPLMREGEAIGVITVLRDHVEAFTGRQIALIKTFADQAVIAIENARLLGELRERTDDLTESLEYQTATAEVLGVISRSPTTLQPVLEAMTAAAVRLCGVKTGGLSVRRGDRLEFVALVGQTPAFERWQASMPIPVARGVPLGDAILDKAPVQIVDVMETDAYKAGAEVERAVVDLGGHRTILHVPLLREDEAIGVLTVSRAEPLAFTERQIGLIETFADQAVIAMENARLLSELRESLDQQTATSDVLSTISRSSSVDLPTVLNTLVETVARLCRADQAYMFRRQEGLHHLVASRNVSDETKQYMLANPFTPDRGTTSGRALLERRTVHIPDALADPEYTYREGQKIAGFRTMLGIPLMREDTILGVFVASRTHVEPFSDKEIALASGFADQAVIAIENARLFEELTDRQAELRVTFDNMGDGVVMFDADLKLASWNRNFQELLDIPDSFVTSRPGLEDYIRLLVGRGELGDQDAEQQIATYRERASQQWSAERTRPDGRILEVRNNPVPGGGAVLIYSDITERKKAEANIRTARDAAEAALLQLKAAQANLVQSEKMASLGQLTAGIAHEIKNPLNFVNNFASLSVELLDELKEIAGPALETLDGEKRADVDETIGLLTGNLGKIAEHGKRADGIVKSMLSHSRGGSGDWQASDINTLVEEALNLAYHGARAQDKEFNVTLERDFEKESKPIELVPQDVMRVFLNLVGNGFYAVNKRRLGKEAGYRPTLKVSTRDLGDKVEIRVRDNGIGIPAEVRDKMFQPFFTTKPTGEGTGLGLSISYDIVTQQHGGAIEVESEVGRFAEFTVRLPRIPRVASAKRT